MLQSIVLEIARRQKQRSGHVAGGISQNGLVDLDLLRRVDGGVVGLVGGRVGVVVVPGNRAIGAYRTGLEDDLAARVSRDDVQPRSAGGEAGR